MTIDLLTFTFSVLIGLPIGVTLGIVGLKHTADIFAGQIFDSLVRTRAQAKEQMDTYADAQK